MSQKSPSQETLNRHLSYDPDTGVVIWLKRKPVEFRPGAHSQEHMCKTWNSRFAGKPAGTKGPDGHLHIRYDGRVYRLHRIIWMMVHGEWPKIDVDHINCIKDDNRISNLRLATRHQNLANTRVRKTNKLGLKGVYLHKAPNSYRSLIRVRGKRIDLGIFQSPEEAAAAYKKAAERYFGDFARVS